MPSSTKRPLGFLRANVNPDVAMMICTAGHVDHGKTQLVKLLTGCNTDRLKVEQERGMTIELGFAPCFLGGELCVGIVDVPGHEKFVKNMVAGVSGIGMCILVIAADDGVMPQTIEHLQIMELLGVRRGMVALTKTDLVAPDQVHGRVDEIRDFLRGTFLDGCPICPVSSETFEGYEAFYGTLVEMVRSVARNRPPGVFRMPVERVFARPGFGVVVTGIPVAGSIEVGAEVEAIPGGQRGRIRGIQRFLRDSPVGGAGQCLALNIPDFGKKPPVRGQALCLPGYIQAVRHCHVQLAIVPGLASPLRNAEEVKFHTGAVEATGKIYLLEGKAIEPGQSGLASIALSEPIAAAVYDRFILRRPSPPATVAGGEILAVTAEEQRPRRTEILARLQAHLSLFNGVDSASVEGMAKRIEGFLLWDAKRGCRKGEIARGILLPADVVEERLAHLAGKGDVLVLQDDCYVHRRSFDACLGEAEAHLRQAAANKTLSVNVGDLRNELQCPPPLWARVQEDIERRNWARRRGDWLILPGAAEQMGEQDRNLMEGILRLYETTEFESPRPEELPALLKAPEPRIAAMLKHLCNEGRLVRLTKHVVLHYTHFKAAQDMVVRTILAQGTVSSADFKNYIGSSRKYAIAILDFLDARRVTVRFDNDRKLTPDYQKHLL